MTRKDPFSLESKVEYGLTIDGEFYSEDKIRQMSYEETKHLCAFCDEIQLKKLWSMTPWDRARIYIDNILLNC